MKTKEDGTPGDAAVDTTAKVDEKQDITPEKTEEKTIGEIQKEAGTDKPKETVGLDKFMEEKKGRQALEKENARLKEDMATLQEQIQGGATKKEVSASIKELASAHDVDPAFLQKFADAIREDTERALDEKYSPQLTALEKKERDEKIEKAFSTHFNLAMERMPDLADAVNREVIKSLSLLPQNSNKTISQLIEEVYGSSVPGKRTVEKTLPGGGKDPQPLDFDRARKDTAYFKEVMADPKLKAEYNKKMLEKGW